MAAALEDKYFHTTIKHMTVNYRRRAPLRAVMSYRASTTNSRRHIREAARARLITTRETLLPSVITVGNLLSMVLAATVITHGDTFCTMAASGPSFPAENTAGTPSCIAWNAPISVLVMNSGMSGGVEPRDAEITWTPSRSASSNAARMSASLHRPVRSLNQHTLYTASRDHGAPRAHAAAQAADVAGVGRHGAHRRRRRVRAVPDAVPRRPVLGAAAGVERADLALEAGEVVARADELPVARRGRVELLALHTRAAP